jgi:hypothetical protein
MTVLNSYTSLYVFAHAIRNLTARGLSFRDGPTLKQAILDVSFMGASGNVSFLSFLLIIYSYSLSFFLSSSSFFFFS